MYINSVLKIELETLILNRRVLFPKMSETITIKML